MKLYLIKDIKSGNVVNTLTCENLEVFKRYLISTRLNLQKEVNYSSLRLLNDCEVYECEIVFDENTHELLQLSGLNKVILIKNYFDEFDKKSGSLEDKI